MFDARVFALPRDEVIHYFIWRQQDWIRNSLNMPALCYFSPPKVHRLTRSQRHNKLFTEKGVNCAQLPTHLKNGAYVYKVPFMVRGTTAMTPSVIRSTWMINRETPVFTRDRAYVERHVNIDVQPRATAPQVEKRIHNRLCPMWKTTRREASITHSSYPLARGKARYAL